MIHDVTGEAPTDWRSSPLGEVALLVREKVNPRDVPSEPYLGLEHVEAHTMSLLGQGRGSDVRSTKTRFRSGDVLYGKLRPYLNKVARPDFDGICSTDFLVLRDSTKIESAYLANYLNQLWVADWAHQKSSGVELPRIDWDSLSKLPIAYPPDRAQQRAIVGEVDRVRTLQAEAIKHLDAAASAVRGIRQSVIAAACSGGLTEDLRDDRNAEVALPAGWREETIESIAAKVPRAIQSGPFGSNLKHSEFRETGRLVIGIDNVLDGTFSLGRQHRISRERFKDLEKYAARPLDVLITVMATVGRVCVLPADIEPALITKHVYRITLNQTTANPYFVMYALRGHPSVRAQINSQLRGQTRPGINGAIVRQLVLAIPPLDEQLEIVRRANLLLDFASQAEARIARTSSTVSRAMQAMFVKAFRGEVVLNGAGMRDA